MQSLGVAKTESDVFYPYNIPYTYFYIAFYDYLHSISLVIFQAISKKNITKKIIIDYYWLCLNNSKCWLLCPNL